MKRLLTPALLDQKPSNTQREEIRDTRSPLILRTTERGQRTFIVRPRIRGQKQPIRVSFDAPAHATNLQAARSWAVAVVAKCQQGHDPRADRAAAASSHERNLVRAIVMNFLERHASKNRRCAETKRILNVYGVALGGPHHPPN